MATSEGSSKTQEAPEYPQNKRFFWQLITFVVEDQLFRVPVERLTTDYDVLKDCMEKALKFPTSPYNRVELKDTKASDFEALLDLLYYPKIKQSDADKPDAPVEDRLLSAFRAADFWKFTAAHGIAASLAHLGGTTATCEKIRLGRKYCHNDWLAEAFREFVTGKEGPSADDVKVISAETAVRLYRAREKWQSTRKTTALTGAGYVPEEDPLLKEEFQI